MRDKVRKTWNDRRFRYLLAGGTVYLFNLAVAAALFSLPGAQGTVWTRNITNVIAIEITLIFAFHIHSWFTWRTGFTQYWKRIIRFHLVSFISNGARVLVFLLLDLAGFHWAVSTILSVTLAAVMNLFGYDRLVFRTKRDDENSKKNETEENDSVSSGSGL